MKTIITILAILISTLFFLTTSAQNSSEVTLTYEQNVVSDSEMVSLFVLAKNTKPELEKKLNVLHNTKVQVKEGSIEVTYIEKSSHILQIVDGYGKVIMEEYVTDAEETNIEIERLNFKFSDGDELSRQRSLLLIVGGRIEGYQSTQLSLNIGD